MTAANPLDFSARTGLLAERFAALFYLLLY